MKMKWILYLFAIALCGGCASKDPKGKWQRERDNIIDVKNDVKGINTEDVLIDAYAKPYICGKYLAVADYDSPDKMVHLFNLQTLKYVMSFGNKGQGPTEISSLGTVAWNEEAHDLYVTDHGQRRILKYNLDSLLTDSLYAPTVRLRFGDVNTTFSNDYRYISDTLSYGSFVVTTATSSYRWTGGKWNMKTGEMKLIDYVHPADKKKRVAFAFSLPYQTLVECNLRYDLISLYNLDGELQCNIYGPNWDQNGDRKAHFKNVVVYKDKIIASYIGGDWVKNDGARVLHVFDITGNYLKTLSVGYRVNHISCDEENDRLIMNLDDEMQFAYIDLKNL